MTNTLKETMLRRLEEGESRRRRSGLRRVLEEPLSLCEEGKQFSPLLFPSLTRRDLNQKYTDKAKKLVYPQYYFHLLLDLTTLPTGFRAGAVYLKLCSVL